MKTILFMATTLNGLIARQDGTTNWTSREDWQAFLAKAREVGNIIIGCNTYEIVKKENSFIETKLRIVVTHHPNSFAPTPHTIFTDQSPQKILEVVKDQGFTTALVAGGGQINSLFLAAGVVDEIFIDVEPIILGHGIPLFAPEEFEKRLKLLEMKKLNQDTIQLHYQVLK